MRQFFLAAVLATFTAGCVSPGLMSLDRNNPFVRLFGGDLYLHGVRFPFVGIDAQTMASAVPSDRMSYCGHWYTPEETDNVFHAVRESGGTVVRIWAFRSFTEEGKEFKRIDYALARAKEYGVRVVLVLDHRHGVCAGGKLRNTDWYRKGYMRGGDGFTQSYLDHVAKMAQRYRDEPTIVMWQLMDGDEGTGPDVDVAALYAFVQHAAYTIKHIDPNHLIAFGPSGVSVMNQRPLASNPLIDVHMAADQRKLWFRAWSETSQDCAAMANHHRKACIMSPIGVDFSRETSPLKDLYATLRDGQVASALVTDVDGAFIMANRPGNRMAADLDGVSPAIKAFRFLLHKAWAGTGKHPPY